MLAANATHRARMHHNGDAVNLDSTLSLLASALFLALAALTAIRGRSALALPTAFVCGDLWAYNTLEVISNISDAPYWEWIESAAAAMAAPLLFHLTLTFLGQRRRRRWLLQAAYLYFGVVAVSCVLPIAVPDWGGYPGGDVWALIMLAGLVPFFGYAGVALFLHHRRVGHPEERARTQLYIAAVLIGVGGPAADLAAIAGAGGIPPLASPAMLLSAMLLSAMAMRARFLRGTTRALIVNATLLAITGVTAHLLVFRWLGERTGFLVGGTVVVTALILAAARTVGRAYGQSRERTAELATLGRLSGQMAHDIRNPLAAIRGAAQYLDEERRRGSALEDQQEFIELILDQVDRLDRVVEDYRRLGKAEPRFETTDADALLTKVATGAKLAADAKGVTVTVHDSALGDLDLDPELLITALENLVRNAVEAMEDEGGTVTLKGVLDERGRIVLSVQDDGPGMDARTREQAEEAFFTTKAQGSGLGLAYARRVAEAHQGDLRIDSALGRGTTVSLDLPRARASLPPT